MDQDAHKLYLLVVDAEIARRTGDGFHDYFVRLASLRWGADFEIRRPQGCLGDGKCDGYRVSTKTVFQAYGPRRMEARELLRKIQIDFEGARAAFGARMAGWTLVHNDAEGLPKEAHDLILALRLAHPDLAITVCGPTQLLALAAEMNGPQLALLCPQMPRVRYPPTRAVSHMDALVAQFDAEPAPRVFYSIPDSRHVLESLAREDALWGRAEDARIVGSVRRGRR